MTQIEKNKAELRKDIQELCDMPLSEARGARLAEYMKIYDALCRASCWQREGAASVKDSEGPRFDREIAAAWTSAMVNADGTRGPHWTMDKTKALQSQYGVDCDAVKFYAVINSLYSDYCEALIKSKANTEEVYVCLAKAWLNDADAVEDKAAAYFTHIVEH